jgi:hypothetical protein
MVATQDLERGYIPKSGPCRFIYVCPERSLGSCNTEKFAKTDFYWLVICFFDHVLVTFHHMLSTPEVLYCNYHPVLTDYAMAV